MPSCCSLGLPRLTQFLQAISSSIGLLACALTPCLRQFLQAISSSIELLAHLALNNFSSPARLFCTSSFKISKSNQFFDRASRSPCLEQFLQAIILRSDFLTRPLCVKGAPPKAVGDCYFDQTGCLPFALHSPYLNQLRILRIR